MQSEGADLEHLSSLFASNGDPKEASLLRWRYLDNPTRTLFVDFAFDADADAIAGTYCVSPAWFRVSGERVLGVQSIDTLTDARYRGRGLFKTLATSTYERCRQAGVALVYGFPNQHSAPGFFERLGWSNLDPVPFLVRPIRFGYLARRAGRLGRALAKLPDPAFAPRAPTPRRGLELRSIATFDAETDALWSRFSAPIPVALERSSSYLNWRFVSNPGAAYVRIGLYERGALVGVVVYRVADKHGGRIGYVMELLHEPGRHDVGALLLRSALRGIADDGGEVALAWCLPHSPNRRAFARVGFASLPERLRPIELHFGARAFSPAANAATGRRSWYLSYSDSDTV